MHTIKSTHTVTKTTPPHVQLRLPVLYLIHRQLTESSDGTTFQLGIRIFLPVLGVLADFDFHLVDQLHAATHPLAALLEAVEHFRPGSLTAEFLRQQVLVQLGVALVPVFVALFVEKKKRFSLIR